MFQCTSTSTLSLSCSEKAWVVFQCTSTLSLGCGEKAWVVFQCTSTSTLSFGDSEKAWVAVIVDGTGELANVFFPWFLVELSRVL